MPAPLRVQVGPVGRDLHGKAAYGRPDGPEAFPHGPQVIGARPEEAFYLLGPGVGGGVYVGVGPAEQPVPHVPANQVQLVPSLPERLADGQQGFGNLELLFIVHNHHQILVPMSSKSSEC
jgi:hypothetical protein